MRMREQASAIRKTLRLLRRDVEMAGKRAVKLDNFDFEELVVEEGAVNAVPLGKVTE